MDPASAIGLVGAVVGIVDVLAKSVSTLSDLQSRYKNADVRLSLLIGQLTTMKAALGHVADLVQEQPVASRYDQFFIDLRMSLQGCEALIVPLDDRLTALRRTESNGLTVSSRMALMWDDATLNDYTNMLTNQINALHLLLTALRCRSELERNNVLQDSWSRRVFDQIKDDTSSLLWLIDADSFGSRARRAQSIHEPAGQDDLSSVNNVFDFDGEIMASRVYRTAMRSNMIFAIETGGNYRQQQNPELSRSDGASHTSSRSLGLRRRFSIRSERVSNRSPSLSTHHRGTWDASDDNAASVFSSSGSTITLPLVHGTRDVDDDDDDDDVDGLSIRSSWSTIASKFTAHRQQQQPHKRRQLTADARHLHVTPAQAPADTTTVMLLGGPESGKSTVIKSLAAAASSEGAQCFDAAARLAQRCAVRDSLARSLSDLRNVVSLVEDGVSATRGGGQMVDLLAAGGGPGRRGGRRSEEGEEGERACRRHFDALKGSIDIYLESESASEAAGTEPIRGPWLDSDIAALWRHHLTQRLVEKVRELGGVFPVDVEYFLSSIERISSPAYIPSVPDILRSYTKTTGVSASSFRADGATYTFFDVGGNESRKWPAICRQIQPRVAVFVFDTAAGLLLTEGTTGRNNAALEAQLEVWRDCARGLRNKDMVVLFTKIDLLTESALKKIKRGSGMGSFEDYEDGHDVEYHLSFLAAKMAAHVEEGDGDTGKRSVSFWHANIASSTTEIADVVLAALQKTTGLNVHVEDV